MNSQKRKRVVKLQVDPQERILDEWESNFYESLKNSSGSEYEDAEQPTEDTANGKTCKNKRIRKAAAQKKSLKSEKKGNLIKLNTNLKQMVLDESGTPGGMYPANSYALCTGSAPPERPFALCLSCFGRAGTGRCVGCHRALCHACQPIHKESGCQFGGS